MKEETERFKSAEGFATVETEAVAQQKPEGSGLSREVRDLLREFGLR